MNRRGPFNVCATRFSINSRNYLSPQHTIDSPCFILCLQVCFEQFDASFSFRKSKLWELRSSLKETFFSAISSKRVTTLFVRSFVASEYSSCVRVVDWANHAFSRMKSHCSPFCLTKFYQPFPGTVFKLRTLCYLAKNVKEMLSTKTDSNSTAQQTRRVNRVRVTSHKFTVLKTKET